MFAECPAGTIATNTANENAQFDFVIEGPHAGSDPSAALINTNQNSLAVPNGNILRLTPGCDTEQEVFVTEFALDVMYVSKVTVTFEMVDGQEKEEVRIICNAMYRNHKAIRVKSGIWPIKKRKKKQF